MAVEREAAEADFDTPRRDFVSHVRQYNRFLHLLRWFIVHALLVLPALYFFLVGGNAIAGVIFLALAVGALGYGIISTPEVARDVGHAIEHKADAS